MQKKLINLNSIKDVKIIMIFKELVYFNVLNIDDNDFNIVLIN